MLQADVESSGGAKGMVLLLQYRNRKISGCEDVELGALGLHVHVPVPVVSELREDQSR